MTWTVAGFGDFSGNANETDMLLENSSTGALEVYDISHNAVTTAASMGAVGLEWQVAGIAADPAAGGSSAVLSSAVLSSASTALLVQAMASLGANAAPISTPAAVLAGSTCRQHTLLSIPR